MKTRKPIISKQISIEQITKCCNDDLTIFMQHFFYFEFTWMKNAYNAFRDFDKYIILVYLVNKTLKIYNNHFYNLSFEDFYNSKSFEIEKISIMELVNELSISKETTRRKLNKLNKIGIIKRNKKNISVVNPFMSQKPINNIKALSKLLSFISIKLKKIYGLDSYSDEYFKQIILKNYTHCWYIVIEFQMKYFKELKKLFGSFDNIYIFGTCIVNQSLNLKNAKKNKDENLLNLNNFPKFLTDYTKYKSKGLNPTTISELTLIPRASVVRKLKKLIDNKMLVRNKQNLYAVSTSKENPVAFSKISKIFDKNQFLLRNCLKDLFNYLI
jgi:predicted transcriptional regulator